MVGLKPAWILAQKRNNDNTSYWLCAIPIVWRKAKLSRLLMGQTKINCRLALCLAAASFAPNQCFWSGPLY